MNQFEKGPDWKSMPLTIVDDLALRTRRVRMKGESPTRAHQRAHNAAAQLALAAALPEEIRRRIGGTNPITVVIEVPDSDWCEPVKKALIQIIPSAQHRMKHVVCDGTERNHAPDQHNDLVIEGLGDGYTIVGIAPNARKFLPRTLAAAPDFSVSVRPLDGVLVEAVIAAIAKGGRRRPIADQLVATLGLSDLAVAIRPGSTVSQCHSRLRKLADARSMRIGDDIPRLEELSGTGEAGEWGRALAPQMGRYKRGLCTWNDVADVGCILFGDTGVGKSQIARSIARSCDIPLVETSYAHWQSAGMGHLGDLLKSMVESMAMARRLAPSLWFVDEIDSMPNRAGPTREHDAYYKAVVNGMLAIAERQSRPGVVIVGACNDASNLDAALIRPGRFGDRILRVPRPSESALVGIIRYHLGTDLLDTDLVPLARAANGATGADVVAWIRRARRCAAEQNRALTVGDVMTVFAPIDHRSPQDIVRAAVHEAGHAVVSVKTGKPVEFVSILLRGIAGGNASVPRVSTPYPTLENLENEATTGLAGRAAEQALIGAPSTACAGYEESDLAIVTNLVASLHASFGFGLSPVFYASGREVQKILREDADLRGRVETHVSRLYDRSMQLVVQNAQTIRALAGRLIETRYLGGDEIQAVIEAAERKLQRIASTAQSQSEAAAPPQKKNRPVASQSPQREAPKENAAAKEKERKSPC